MAQNQKCGSGKCSTTPEAEERIINPSVDITETDEALFLRADMPGVSEDDVDVTLEDHVLTLDAKRCGFDFEGVEPAYVEYHTGRYQRSFKVAEEIEQDAIEATLKDGVLQVTLPKAKSRLAQRIKVLPA